LEKNRRQHQVESLGYSEQETLALAILDQRQEELEEKLEASDAKVRQLEGQERQLRARREDSNSAFSLASRRSVERQEQLDELERMPYPGLPSLLEFLRREQPGWEARLGKIVHPALLQRTDLKPQLSDADPHSLFGVRLDLSALDIPEHAASEQQLRQ